MQPVTALADHGSASFYFSRSSSSLSADIASSDTMKASRDLCISLSLNYASATGDDSEFRFVFSTSSSRCISLDRELIYDSFRRAQSPSTFSRRTLTSAIKSPSRTVVRDFVGREIERPRLGRFESILFLSSFYLCPRTFGSRIALDEYHAPYGGASFS